jgi:hypothetical protein
MLLIFLFLILITHTQQSALLKILYKTSLASPLFIDFPVPIQESERFLRFFEWNLELFGWGVKIHVRHEKRDIIINPYNITFARNI